MTKIKRGAAQRLAELDGKSLFDMYFMTSKDPAPVMKDYLANSLNETYNLNYQRRHVDNWVAGRKKTPAVAEAFMREKVLQYALGDEAAWVLRALF